MRFICFHNLRFFKLLAKKIPTFTTKKGVSYFSIICTACMKAFGFVLLPFKLLLSKKVSLLHKIHDIAFQRVFLVWMSLFI